MLSLFHVFGRLFCLVTFAPLLQGDQCSPNFARLRQSSSRCAHACGIRRYYTLEPACFDTSEPATKGATFLEREKLLGWRDAPQNICLMKLRYIRAAKAHKEGRDIKREMGGNKHIVDSKKKSKRYHSADLNSFIAVSHQSMTHLEIPPIDQHAWPQFSLALCVQTQCNKNTPLPRRNHVHPSNHNLALGCLCPTVELPFLKGASIFWRHCQFEIARVEEGCSIRLDFDKSWSIHRRLIYLGWYSHLLRPFNLPYIQKSLRNSIQEELCSATRCVIKPSTSYCECMLSSSQPSCKKQQTEFHNHYSRDVIKNCFCHVRPDRTQPLSCRSLSDTCWCYIIVLDEWHFGSMDRKSNIYSSKKLRKTHLEAHDSFLYSACRGLNASG